jgi:transketolase
MISPAPSNFDVSAAKKRCLQLRKRVLEISQQVPALHIAGTFSALEVVDCIYHGLMRMDKNNESPDTFVLSKGHGCMVQYISLENLGILTKKDLDLFCLPGGQLGVHPDYGVPGIAASTGSLGHGMGLCTGMAYTEKYIKKSDAKIYVTLSDGEFQEGSTWECLMMAANLGVNNLIAFMDHNGFQTFGRTSKTHPSFYPIKEKIEAFGWEVEEVNGHDAQAVYDAVNNREGSKPFFVVANTIKGRGVSYMEEVPMWHYRSPNPEELKEALDNLEEVSS